MTAVLGFEGLRIRCIIGVLPHERIEEQDLYVDCSVRTNVSEAVATDSVEGTVDYSKLAALCTQTAREGRFKLLETFLNDSMDRILEDPRVKWVRLTGRKPDAMELADACVVTMERRQGEE